MHSLLQAICILPFPTSRHLYCLPAIETSHVPQPVTLQLHHPSMPHICNPMMLNAMCVERYFILRVLYQVMWSKEGQQRGRGAVRLVSISERLN